VSACELITFLLHGRRIRDGLSITAVKDHSKQRDRRIGPPETADCGAGRRARGRDQSGIERVTVRPDPL